MVEESKNLEPAKKMLVFYYGGCAQNIKFYEGTPAEEILKLALARFGLEDEKCKDIFFIDEDGDPLVFSPSNMPSGCKIYLQLNRVLPKQA